MLHEKPVVTFGRCDYEAATINGNIDKLEETWNLVEQDDHDKRIQLYTNWYDWFVNKATFNTKKG